MGREKTGARSEGSQGAGQELDADESGASVVSVSQDGDSENPAGAGESLSRAEQEVLADAETTIDRGLQTFIEVGEALALVRDRRLYREVYGTFEAYCQQRWDLTPQHVNRTIAASGIVSAMEPTGSIVPTSERQARELSGLDPDEAADVMRRANEATDGKPTASAIREVRSRDKETAPKSPPKSAFQQRLADLPPDLVDRVRRDNMTLTEAEQVAAERRERIQAWTTRLRDAIGLLARMAGNPVPDSLVVGMTETEYALARTLKARLERDDMQDKVRALAENPTM